MAIRTKTITHSLLTNIHHKKYKIKRMSYHQIEPLKRGMLDSKHLNMR
jgi:hypothetical protein